MGKKDYILLGAIDHKLQFVNTVAIINDITPTINRKGNLSEIKLEVLDQSTPQSPGLLIFVCLESKVLSQLLDTARRGLLVELLELEVFKNEGVTYGKVSEEEELKLYNEKSAHVKWYPEEEPSSIPDKAKSNVKKLLEWKTKYFINISQSSLIKDPDDDVRPSRSSSAGGAKSTKKSTTLNVTAGTFENRTPKRINKNSKNEESKEENTLNGKRTFSRSSLPDISNEKAKNGVISKKDNVKKFPLKEIKSGSSFTRSTSLGKHEESRRTRSNSPMVKKAGGQATNKTLKRTESLQSVKSNVLLDLKRSARNISKTDLDNSKSEQNSQKTSISLRKSNSNNSPTIDKNNPQVKKNRTPNDDANNKRPGETSSPRQRKLDSSSDKDNSDIKRSARISRSKLTDDSLSPQIENKTSPMNSQMTHRSSRSKLNITDNSSIRSSPKRIENKTTKSTNIPKEQSDSIIRKRSGSRLHNTDIDMDTHTNSISFSPERIKTSNDKSKQGIGIAKKTKLKHIENEKFNSPSKSPIRTKSINVSKEENKKSIRKSRSSRTNNIDLDTDSDMSSTSSPPIKLKSVNEKSKQRNEIIKKAKLKNKEDQNSSPSKRTKSIENKSSIRESSRSRANYADSDTDSDTRSTSSSPDKLKNSNERSKQRINTLNKTKLKHQQDKKKNSPSKSPKGTSSFENKRIIRKSSRSEANDTDSDTDSDTDTNASFTSSSSENLTLKHIKDKKYNSQSTSQNRTRSIENKKSIRKSKRSRPNYTYVDTDTDSSSTSSSYEKLKNSNKKSKQGIKILNKTNLKQTGDRTSSSSTNSINKTGSTNLLTEQNESLKKSKVTQQKPEKSLPTPSSYDRPTRAAKKAVDEELSSVKSRTRQQPLENTNQAQAITDRKNHTIYNCLKSFAKQNEILKVERLTDVSEYNLEDIEVPEKFDITCKVISKTTLVEDCVEVVRVTDGSLSQTGVLILPQAASWALIAQSVQEKPLVKKGCPFMDIIIFDYTRLDTQINPNQKYKYKICNINAVKFERKMGKQDKQLNLELFFFVEGKNAYPKRKWDKDLEKKLNEENFKKVWNKFCQDEDLKNSLPSLSVFIDKQSSSLPKDSLTNNKKPITGSSTPGNKLKLDDSPVRSKNDSPSGRRKTNDPLVQSKVESPKTRRKTDAPSVQSTDDSPIRNKTEHPSVHSGREPSSRRKTLNTLEVKSEVDSPTLHRRKTDGPSDQSKDDSPTRKKTENSPVHSREEPSSRRKPVNAQELKSKVDSPTLQRRKTDETSDQAKGNLRRRARIGDSPIESNDDSPTRKTKTKASSDQSKDDSFGRKRKGADTPVQLKNLSPNKKEKYGDTHIPSKDSSTSKKRKTCDNAFQQEDDSSNRNSLIEDIKTNKGSGKKLLKNMTPKSSEVKKLQQTKNFNTESTDETMIKDTPTFIKELNEIMQEEELMGLPQTASEDVHLKNSGSVVTFSQFCEGTKGKEANFRTSTQDTNDDASDRLNKMDSKITSEDKMEPLVYCPSGSSSPGHGCSSTATSGPRLSIEESDDESVHHSHRGASKQNLKHAQTKIKGIFIQKTLEDNDSVKSVENVNSSNSSEIVFEVVNQTNHKKNYSSNNLYGKRKCSKDDNRKQSEIAELGENALPKSPKIRTIDVEEESVIYERGLSNGRCAENVDQQIEVVSDVSSSCTLLSIENKVRNAHVNGEENTSREQGAEGDRDIQPILCYLEENIKNIPERCFFRSSVQRQIPTRSDLDEIYNEENEKRSFSYSLDRGLPFLTFSMVDRLINTNTAIISAVVSTTCPALKECWEEKCIKAQCPMCKKLFDVYNANHGINKDDTSTDALCLGSHIVCPHSKCGNQILEDPEFHISVDLKLRDGTPLKALIGGSVAEEFFGCTAQEAVTSREKLIQVTNIVQNIQKSISDERPVKIKVTRKNIGDPKSGPLYIKNIFT